MSIRICSSFLIASAGVAIVLRPGTAPESTPRAETATVTSFHSGADALEIRFEGARVAARGEVIALDVVVSSRSADAERVALQLELPPGLVLENRDVLVRGALESKLIETAPRAEISGHVVLDLRDSFAAGEEKRFEILLSSDAAERRGTSIQARVGRFAANGRIDRMTVSDAYQFLDLGPAGIEPRTIAELQERRDAPDADGLDRGLEDGPRAGRPVAAVNVRTVIDPRAGSTDPFAAHCTPINRPFHDVPDAR